MRVIAIGGVPGTGKTTLVKKLIRTFKEQHTVEFKVKTFRATHYRDDDVIIAGEYDGAVNDGTDRLSMAVQPDAIKFMEWIMGAPLHENSVLIFEGDRLFNISFLTYLRMLMHKDLTILILLAGERELIKRYEKRGTNQSLSFIKGRDTKIRNISINLHCEVKNNNDEFEQASILREILDLIKNRQR